MVILGIRFEEYIRGIYRGSFEDIDAELTARTAPSGKTYRFITIASSNLGNKPTINLNELDLLFEWNGSASNDRQEYICYLSKDQVKQIRQFKPIEDSRPIGDSRKEKISKGLLTYTGRYSTRLNRPWLVPFRKYVGISDITAQELIP